MLLFAPNFFFKDFALKSPRFVHDDLISDWAGIYKKLEDIHNRFSGRCVVDSALAMGNFPFPIKYLQDSLMVSDEIAYIRKFISQDTSFWKKKRRAVFTKKSEKKKLFYLQYYLSTSKPFLLTLIRYYQRLCQR